ncbi:hypothetical protein MXB_3162 [Myxobolus squamalis]|nr:hypothetical protein MXB_3162 [Myxobolus squamalis]
MSSSQEEIVDQRKYIIYQDNHDSYDVDKTMGFLKSSSFVFASIMGTGIFISVSDTFNVFSSNNILFVILLWIFGGFVAIIGSLCYAEVGNSFLKTARECVFYKKTLGKSWSVLFVIMSVFVVKTLSLASFALVASTYLVNTFVIPSSIDHDDTTIIFAIIFLDIRNPSINLPLSNVVGVSSITIIYVLIIISYSSVLGYSHVRISKTVALSFAKLTMGPFYPMISVIVCFSALGDAVNTLYTCTEITAHAELEGILPTFFSSTHKKRMIPHASIIFMVYILISICFVFFKLQTLLNFFTLVNWGFYFLSFTCMFIMKYKTNTLSYTTKSAKIFRYVRNYYIILRSTTYLLSLFKYFLFLLLEYAFTTTFSDV